jgi:hypothetical protein
MEITYTDSEGNESTIVPLRFEAEPLVYHVPSSLTYEGSTEQSSSWTDWYTHPGGWKLSVQRYFLELEGEGTDDGYLMLAERAQDIPTCTVRPARLQSGFSMITYEEPSDEGELIARLCCELCAIRDNLLAVVLYAAEIPLADLGNPDVILHARIIKHMGKMTEWWEGE